MPNKIITRHKTENDRIKEDIKHTDEKVKDDSFSSENKTE